MVEFGKVFKEYSILSKVDISKMTIHELTNHNLELKRLELLGTKLFYKIEAGQIKDTLK